MNPLADLRDIHAAPDPGFWPLAPGWWLLAVLLLITLVALGYAIRWYRRRRRQQAILKQFRIVYRTYQDHLDTTRLAAELHRLMRRVMLAAGAQRQLGLSGEAFLDYLDSGAAGQPFTSGPGRALLDAPYQRQAEVDAEALQAVVQNWARRQLRGIR